MKISLPYVYTIGKTFARQRKGLLSYIYCHILHAEQRIYANVFNEQNMTLPHIRLWSVAQ